MKLSKLSTSSEVDASKQAFNNSSDIRSKMCKHIRDINSFEIQLFHKECVQNKKVKNNDT